MKLEELQVIFSANSVKLQSQMSILNRQLKKLRDDVAKVNESTATSTAEATAKVAESGSSVSKVFEGVVTELAGKGGQIGAIVQGIISKAGPVALAITAGVSLILGALNMVNKAMERVRKAIENIKTAIKFLISSFISLVKQAVTTGAEFTRLKTATNVITQNMGITTDEVDNLREALAQANTYGIEAEEVIKTLAMSGLVDMARELRTVDARTGETVTGVTALVLGMKDLAAASGYDSATGIERLTRFIRRGEIALADGLIEIGYINKAYSEYAKSIGKTTSQLTEQETAIVRMNIVMEESRKAFGVYASINQTFSKAIQSSQNAFKDTIAMIGDYFAPALNVAGNAIYQFIYGIREFVKSNAESIKSFAVVVASYALAVVRILGNTLSRIPFIGKYFKGLATLSVKTTGAIGKMSSVSSGAATGMDNFADSTARANKELLGLASFDEMNVLNKAEEAGGAGGGGGGFDVGDIGVDIGGGAGELGSMMEGIASEINIKATEIENRINNMIRKINGFFAPLTRFYKIYIEPNYNQIRDAINNLIGTGLIPLGNSIIRLREALFGTQKQTDKTSSSLTFMDIILQPLGWSINNMTNSLLWLIEGLRRLSIKLTELNYKLIEAKLKFDDFIGSLPQRFDDLKNNVVFIMGFIRDFIINAFGEAWKKAAHYIDLIKSRIPSIGEGLSLVGEMISSGFKYIINRLIDKINDFIWRLNSMKLPAVFGRISIGYIPRLAKGGVVNEPTLAQIGESGREAVMPLENNTGWITDLAKMINERGGAGGAINLTVKIGEDKIYDKVVDYLNDKTMLSNTNLLRI